MANYLSKYSLRETDLPFRISSIPSFMSLTKAESERISKVSFMLSNSCFEIVTVCVITILYSILYLKVAENECLTNELAVC